MTSHRNTAYAASAMFVSAALWPNVLCALTELTASPLERALATAWCGAAPQAYAVLGHCPACWTGASAFVLAGLMMLTQRPAFGARAST